MSGVAALGHVRRQPAPEVAITKAGNLGEKRQAQTRLQVAPNAQQIGSDGEIEEQRPSKGEQYADGTQTLVDEAQLASEVEERSEKQGFDDEAPGGEEQRRHQGRRRQESIGPQRVEQFTPRQAWRLLQGHGKLR